MWPPGSADMVCPTASNPDRLTLKLVCESHLRWRTFLPNLGTLGLWVLELFAMYATDGQTDRRTKATLKGLGLGTYNPGLEAPGLGCEVCGLGLGINILASLCHWFHLRNDQTTDYRAVRQQTCETILSHHFNKKNRQKHRSRCTIRTVYTCTIK